MLQTLDGGAELLDFSQQLTIPTPFAKKSLQTRVAFVMLFRVTFKNG